MHVRQALREDALEQTLVRRVGVGVKQRHRHRLWLRAGESVDERVSGVAFERAQWAVRSHPLGYAEPQLLGYERRRCRLAKSVQMRTVLAAELDHVGEAFRSQQRGARGAALQQRVRRDRHPVGEALHLCSARCGSREHQGDRLQHRLRLPRRRRRDLRGVHGGACVDQDRVGERAADVDPQEHALRLRKTTMAPAA